MESKPDGVWDCLLSNSSGASWIRFETDALRHIASAAGAEVGGGIAGT